MSNPEGKSFDATINRVVERFRDPVPLGRQILEARDFLPADECILVQVFAHGSRSIGLDEPVDLRLPGIETFWAFRSDRIYRFTIDERGFDWGVPDIAEPLLRSIGHVKDDEVLVLERQDEADRELGPEDTLRLADSGTEHLRTKKRLVTVYYGVDDKPFKLEPGVYSTVALMDIFKVPAGYLLNVKHGDKLEPLKPGQELPIKNGMHFYSQPPGGASS